MQTTNDFDRVADAQLTELDATYNADPILEQNDGQSPQQTFGEDLAEHSVAFEAYVTLQQALWN